MQVYTDVALLLDVDECEREEPCANAQCNNIDGSYTCGPCYHGFIEIMKQNPQSPCCELNFKEELIRC